MPSRFALLQSILQPLPNHVTVVSRRSCCALAQSYPQLSRDLFNAAFVSCWCELDREHQKELLDAIRLALRSQEIPEITQTLLNLAEFMEHCDIVSQLRYRELWENCDIVS